MNDAYLPRPRCEPAVLLFRGRGVLSALIRWQTRSRYSHAALLLPDGTILEAWHKGGVRHRRLKDWRGIDAFAVEGMTGRDWDVTIRTAKMDLGKGYDFLGVLRFLSRRKHDESKRLFCSEYVFARVRDGGVDLLRRIHPAEVSPGLLSLSPVLRPIWRDSGPHWENGLERGRL